MLFWVPGLLLLLGVFFWLFSEVLTPFVLGLTIAYLLNPALLRLEKLNINRTLATVFLLTLFFVAVILLLILIIPPLYREIAQLVQTAPDFLQALGDRFQPYLSLVQERVESGELEQNIRNAVENNISNAFSLSSSILSGLLSGGAAIASFLSILLITPLVAFFMMREWPSLVKKTDDLLPRDNYDVIKGLIGKIDGKISGFVRGQLMVALFLGIIYAIALSIAGLDYGFLIGLVSGFLSIIPLFGSIVGFIVGVTVAWIQTSEITFVLTIAVIFVCGQLLEGNVIAPKLLGESVGMHPLWILFSILAGASLLGIVGMLIAVPLAATIGVLVGFALEKYQDSEYYQSS